MATAPRGAWGHVQNMSRRREQLHIQNRGRYRTRAYTAHTSSWCQHQGRILAVRTASAAAETHMFTVRLAHVHSVPRVCTGLLLLVVPSGWLAGVMQHKRVAGYHWWSTENQRPELQK